MEKKILAPHQHMPVRLLDETAWLDIQHRLLKTAAAAVSAVAVLTQRKHAKHAMQQKCWTHSQQCCCCCCAFFTCNATHRNTGSETECVLTSRAAISAAARRLLLLLLESPKRNTQDTANKTNRMCAHQKLRHQCCSETAAAFAASKLAT
jgi:hypothetical protein